MTSIPIPSGTRDGFPFPLVVSGTNLALSDYETQATLARAVQVLACRRRLAIPGPCYRTMDSSKLTTLTLPFVAQRENYARSLRLMGWYSVDLPEGVVECNARITNPSLTISETLHLPFTGGTISEFAVDFELGDGTGTAYGQIEGYVEFRMIDWTPRDQTATFRLLGYNFDPEEAGRVDV